MEDYCECEIYYNNFKTIFTLLRKQYESFMKSKVKDKDKINKNKYDKLESIYTSLTQMFKSLPEKGDNCISFMKNCQKDHESQIEEITSELSKLEALSQRIEDYHQSLMKQMKLKTWLMTRRRWKRR